MGGERKRGGEGRGGEGRFFWGRTDLRYGLFKFVSVDENNDSRSHVFHSLSSSFVRVANFLR